MRSLLLAALLVPSLAAADLTVDLEAAAEQWIDAQATTGGIDFPEAVTLEPRRTFSWAGGTRVRLEQFVQGLPVIGEEVVLSYGLDGALRRVQGEPVAGVLMDVTPTVPAAVATTLAQALVNTAYGSGQLWPARASLAVDASDGLTLAWRVDVSAAEPVGAWEFVVDAQTGAVLRWGPTMHSAEGIIYPENPIVSEQVQVELPRLSQAFDGMQGTYAFVNSCTQVSNNQGQDTCTEKTKYALPDANGDYLFSADPSELVDPFAEVMMYYHLDYISHWFATEQGFEHFSPMEGLVNFEVSNAFFGDFDGDGRGEVAFGMANLVDFAYDADVIYHEFMHSVFGQIVSTSFIGSDEYGLDWASGGLNEGSADVLAIVQTEDPLLGEYAGRGFYGPLSNRPVRDLTELRHCPEDLYGESHRDGEVWASLGWAMTDHPDIGAELTADLFYGAITGFPDGVNWEEAGQALQDAADDLFDADSISQEAHDAIIELGTRSGVIGCGRVIALDGGVVSTQLLIHPGWFGDVNLPVGAQYSLDAPADAGRVRLKITNWLTSNANVAYMLYVRRGEPIWHEQVAVNTGFGQFNVPVPTDFDFAVEGSGGDFTIEVLPDGSIADGGVDGLPALEPGATYYFSVASRQTGTVQGYANAEITVEGDIWIDPGLSGDDDDDDAAGTACNDCSSSVAAAPGGLLLLPLLAWRRRR